MTTEDIKRIQAALGVAADGVLGPQSLKALFTRLGIADAPSEAPAGSAAVPTYDRAAMIAELRRDEGERLKAYKDTVGKWTIGIGRNLDDVGISPQETSTLGITTASARANGITAEQSAALLASDLDRVDRDLDRQLRFWRKLDPVRQRVLVNMCFNMGIGGLCGFKNTLGMIERGEYADAAAAMLLSKWAKQVGERAGRLSAMMRTGT